MFLNSYTSNWAPLAYYRCNTYFDATYGLEKSALYGLENIGMESVWTPNFDGGVNGDGILVAVLDTGVDPTHPELRDNIYRFTDKQHLLLKKILFVMGYLQEMFVNKRRGLGL